MLWRCITNLVDIKQIKKLEESKKKVCNKREKEKVTKLNFIYIYIYIYIYIISLSYLINNKYFGSLNGTKMNMS